ncbi:MAG: cation transporter [Tannerella sp.]|jgi:Co/Zn/Cd efflux system component|nr:cation transporter [Tannerella sp.]
MQKTTFKIAKMDCPSEEQLVRMKLDGVAAIRSLSFDPGGRLLHVYHTGDYAEILRRLDALRLDTVLLSSAPADGCAPASGHAGERKILLATLAINLSFFVIESVAGFISRSMSLIADSLDMLADSIVYALALAVVGGTAARKRNVARFAGYFQLALAVAGFTEVVRRFAGVEETPDFKTIICVSLAALAANVTCLCLLMKSRNREAHIRASTICTSNDVIINVGVIVAGLLVYLLHSRYPDLIVGAVVFVAVTVYACKILRLSKGN